MLCLTNLKEMKMTKIYPYNNGSASAKALAEKLGIKRLKKQGKDIHVRGSIINWGCSFLDRNLTYEGEFLNHPDAVAKAANKLETFKALDGKVGIPKWTTLALEASKWVQKEGKSVVSRLTLTGHSGEGIVITNPDDPEDVPDAPIYTQYIKKKEEYRVHVFQGKVIFQQRKARKHGVEDDKVNWQVRNLAGGFIFANKDVNIPAEGLQQAVKAVDLLGLDFGAVDLMLGVDKQFYVLEVNTACGLQGSTLDAYVDAFKEYV